MVGELLLDLLVRGSNPSGVGLLLGFVVRSWNPTCPIRVHLSVDTGKDTCDEGNNFGKALVTINSVLENVVYTGA